MLKVRQLTGTQKGQAMVEYAYILLYVAIAAFVSFQLLGFSLRQFYERIPGMF